MLIDQHKKGDITKAIVDILNNDRPCTLKRHVLIKELLWHIEYPRGIAGTLTLEPPAFSFAAKSLW